MGVIIHGKNVELPNGIECLNFVNDHETHFKHKPRKKALQHLVIHETAGISGSGCRRTLERKGYGIHLICWRNGKFTNHCDLATETTIHANQLNGTSIGIEVVNPYYPNTARRAPYAVDAIPAQWWTHRYKKENGYVLPSVSQMESLKTVVPWLCKTLNIPYTYPTWYLNRRQRKIKRWQLRAKPDAGIVAHRDFSSHSDGRWILERLILDLAFNVFEGD